MYEIQFLALLLGAIDVISVAILAVSVVVFGGLALFGLLLGGTETATVKTYRGGRLISSQSYTQTFSESVFNPKFRVVGNSLYLGGRISNAISVPASERFTGVLKFVFGMHCLSALFGIIYLTVNARTLISAANWHYVLCMGIALIILNGVNTFVIIITSRWSSILAILTLLVKFALAFFAGYNYFNKNFDLITGLSTEVLQQPLHDTLSIVGIALWGVFFLLCCILPVAPARGRLSPKETPRAYLLPYAHMYHSIDYWRDKNFAQDNRGEMFLHINLWIRGPVIIASIIGAIVARPVQGQAASPVFYLWITLLVIFALLALKDFLSVPISKRLASNEYILRKIRHTKSAKRLYRYATGEFSRQVRAAAAAKLPPEVAEKIKI